eukprot:COSAG01_NODE_8983_length_2594_cov_9.563527_2_plen_106_part_00
MLFEALRRSSADFGASVGREYTGRVCDYIQDVRWPAADDAVRREHEEEFMDVQLTVGGDDSPAHTPASPRLPPLSRQPRVPACRGPCVRACVRACVRGWGPSGGG